MGRYFISLIFFALCFVEVSGQFYTTGRGRTSTKWEEIDGRGYQIAYPEGFDRRANGLSTLLDSVYQSISYGGLSAPQRVPIILRTESVYSNGYVVWAPKREELVMTPQLNSIALSWTKHLAIHEWRHVAQISSLNHGITKVATWLLGQGGYAVGLFGVPRWIMEGDATIAETTFSEFGRGVQPDFTIEYRAMFADGQRNFKRLDPWICGSYRVHYPDIYKFGYQTLNAAQSYLGADYFGDMMRYAGKWPIFIVPTSIYLRDHHQSSFKKIARLAFSELDSLWAPHAMVEENFTHLTSSPNKRTYYGNYSSPVPYDRGAILALHSSYDTPTQLLAIVESQHRRVAPIGSVSSPPIIVGDTYYYTEYTPHPIFEQVSFSSIKALDLSTKRTKTYHRYDRNWCITKTPTGFATISLDSLSNSYIQCFDSNFTKTTSIRFPQAEISLHGLTYDTSTQRLYYIGLDRRGMWIGSVDSCGRAVAEVTKPSVVSIEGLRAEHGTLYFSSIESGKNEIHSIDLGTQREEQVTRSAFGSVAPQPVGDSLLLFTTYTSSGYMVASMSKEEEESLGREVKWSRLPQNILNPQRTEWSVAKVDTMDLYGEDMAEESATSTKFKPPFMLHSWAPVGFDGDYLMEARPMDVTVGVTAFFQNSLSTLTGYATYGFLSSTNWLKGRVEYKGLPLTISLGAEYGGGRQFVYGAPTKEEYDRAFGDRELYLSGDISLSLPLNLSSGGYSRLLQPTLRFSYTNSRLYDLNNMEYMTGSFQYSASLWWSSNRYMAKRNLAPRFGYALRANITGDFGGRIGTLYSLFGRVYTPAFAKNHSFALRAAGQIQHSSTYQSSTKALYLTGVNDTSAPEFYTAAEGEYSLPIAYPDWGWDGVIYLKRISANLFGGASYAKDFSGSTLVNYTYGIDLNLDLTLIRSYDQTVSLTFAMPNNRFFFGFGYNIGF